MKYLLTVILLLSFSVNADVDITWTAPAPVVGAEVAGYNLYIGTTSGVYTQTINIPDPLAVTYTTTAIADGVTFAAMTAYTSTGVESPYSNEAVATISGGVVVKSPNAPQNLSF